MRIRILTVTHKTPAWVKAGYEEYAKRLTGRCELELVEIPAEKRGPNADLPRLMRLEEKKLMSAINPQHYIIALEVQGKLWSTETLAEKLAYWLNQGKHIDLLIGGPEGLPTGCLAIANEKWSLSPLTFPHFLVKIIVAEQLYRANSILTGHPYHRA